MSVFIKCGDAAIPVFIQGEETVVSLHTGAKLKRLTVTLQVANDDDDTRASVEGIIQQSLVVETAGPEPRPRIRFANPAPPSFCCQ
jgi:hypothetical protein